MIFYVLILNHTKCVDWFLKEGEKMINPSISGERLIKLRGTKSRTEVARDNISYSTLQMYENGKRTPRDEIKIRLAKYYHTTVHDIFFAE